MNDRGEKTNQSVVADWRFSHQIRVRWAESDMQGVVFNGHYLTYLDIGLTEFLRAAFAPSDIDLHSTFDKLYVVKSTLNYHAPARFDELVDVRVRLARVGRTSLVFEFEIVRDGDSLVSGETIYVHAPQGEPSEVPQPLRQVLTQFGETS